MRTLFVYSTFFQFQENETRLGFELIINIPKCMYSVITRFIISRERKYAKMQVSTVTTYYA